jgi:antitoxin CptB
MLELDVLLGNYLNEVYPTLSIKNKHLFIQLLNCSDPEILAWLLGETRPNNPLFTTIIEAIRHHAQARF